MSYRNILIEEISKAVDGLMEEKKIINPDRITDLICTNHRDELLADAEFSIFNIHSNVRREVRQFISNKFGDNDQQTDDGQLTIEGFEHVQQYYAIERDGIPLVVPIEQMTQDEVLEKAAWHRKCGKAHFDHAEELIKYYEIQLKNVRLPLTRSSKGPASSRL